jgi:hypothetical protein
MVLSLFGNGYSLMEEALPALIEGLSGTGIDISPEDVIVQGPGLVLRAICAYR